MSRFAQILALAASWLAFCLTPAHAKPREALLIGNGAYEATSPLQNPVNDARLMAQTLEAVGFTVTLLEDATQREMRSAILQFGRKLRSGKVEAGLFYYAGHGVQVRGENYLIPVNAMIQSEDEIELEGVNVNDFLQVMESSTTDINIVILDACRNNPFARSFRSARRGLATVDAPKGTLIAYSTAPGDVALDGEGLNSPYTTALAQSIATQGHLPVESVFKATRRSVLGATQDQQLPWESSSVVGDFFFRADPGTAAVAVAAAQPAPQPAIQAKPAEAPYVSAFKRARDLGTREAWQSFVDLYGDEADRLYLDLAQEQLALLSVPRHAPSPVRSNWRCSGNSIALAGGRVCASTTLPAQGNNRYDPQTLIDDHSNTAWVEGEAGDGLGAALVVEFPSPYAVSEIELRNGYNKRADLFDKNGRVREMWVETSLGDQFAVGLYDEGQWQSFRLPPGPPLDWISLSISAVYRGSKYADTAITELRVR